MSAIRPCSTETWETSASPNCRVACGAPIPVDAAGAANRSVDASALESSEVDSAIATPAIPTSSSSAIEIDSGRSSVSGVPGAGDAMATEGGASATSEQVRLAEPVFPELSTAVALNVTSRGPKVPRGGRVTGTSNDSLGHGVKVLVSATGWPSKSSSMDWTSTSSVARTCARTVAPATQTWGPGTWLRLKETLGVSRSISGAIPTVTLLVSVELPAGSNARAQS